jgi:hypothetical protein
MSETDDVKAVPEVEQQLELSEIYQIGDIDEDGLNDSVRRDGQERSQDFSLRSTGSRLSLSLHSRASVIQPPEGLHPVKLTGIVINYISAGYILLPWGKQRPLSVPSTHCSPSASHHSLFSISLCTGWHTIIMHCTGTHCPSVVHDGRIHP